MTIIQRLKIGFDEYPITFSESIGMVAENAPWYLTSLSVFLCSLILVGIIASVASAKLSNRGRKRKRFYKRSLKSYLRLFIIFICIIIVLSGGAIALSFVGVSILNIVLGYGILGMVVGYTFMDAMRNMGAYIIIRWCEKMDEDDWIIQGNIKGKLESLNLLYGEVYNPHTGQNWQQPNTLLAYAEIEVYEEEPKLKIGIIATTTTTESNTSGLRKRSKPLSGVEPSIIPGH